MGIPQRMEIGNARERVSGETVSTKLKSKASSPPTRSTPTQQTEHSSVQFSEAPRWDRHYNNANLPSIIPVARLENGR